MKKIVKHELVEIKIPANSTNTQFPIPDYPNLRWVELMGIQAYYDQIVPFSMISQDAVITKGDMQLGYITLQDYSGNNFLNQCPLVIFQTIENGMTGYTFNIADVDVNYSPSIQEKDFKNFNNQKVNWPKSYINFAQAVTAEEYDRVVLLSVYYVDPQDKKEQATFANKS